MQRTRHGKDGASPLISVFARPEGVIVDGVNPSRVVLPVVAVDAALTRTLGIYGSAWLVRSGLVVTCWHCVPSALPEGQILAVTRKNASGGHDPFPLRDVERDPRGFDLATARADLEAEEEWPLYPGLSQAGMPVWSYGYPLTDYRDEPDGTRTYQMYPRFLQGYVTRRFVGDPPTHPKAELDMHCPPGLSGAPLGYGSKNQVVGIVYGRTTTKVPDEDPAPLYHFGLAYDREILEGLLGAATGGRPLGEVM